LRYPKKLQSNNEQRITNNDLFSASSAREILLVACLCDARKQTGGYAALNLFVANIFALPRQLPCISKEKKTKLTLYF
jgi:hypothetical protein